MNTTNESQINQLVTEFISNHGYPVNSSEYLNQVENLDDAIQREGKLNDVHYEIVKTTKQDKLRVKFRTEKRKDD